MFTRNSKTYAIRRNGKVYLPVRRARKYWKEVTTTKREVEYYCYRGDGILAYMYFLGVPVVGSNKMYYQPSSDIASDKSQLTKSSDVSLTSANENSIIFTDKSSATRYPSGDLYHEVTKTQIVPGTPDDYTYYEDILKYY